jgi:hypothetical protein
MQFPEQGAGPIGCHALPYCWLDGECIETVVAVRNEHGGVSPKRIEMNTARLARSRMHPDFKTTLSAIPADCLCPIALTCALLTLCLALAGRRGGVAGGVCDKTRRTPLFVTPGVRIPIPGIGV